MGSPRKVRCPCVPTRRVRSSSVAHRPFPALRCKYAATFEKDQTLEAQTVCVPILNQKHTWAGRCEGTVGALLEARKGSEGLTRSCIGRRHGHRGCFGPGSRAGVWQGVCVCRPSSATPRQDRRRSGSDLARLQQSRARDEGGTEICPADCWLPP